MIPNILFPFLWVTSMLRRLMGDVTGLVPDERPIFPNQLTKELYNVGFKGDKIKFHGKPLEELSQYTGIYQYRCKSMVTSECQKRFGISICNPCRN